jgi:hypothetical protein
MRIQATIALVCTLLCYGALTAGPADAIVGGEFDSWVAAQRNDVWQSLDSVFLDHPDVVIAGPLAVIDTVRENRDAAPYLSRLRVICLDKSLQRLIDRILVEATNLANRVRTTTIQEERYHIWKLRHHDSADNMDRTKFEEYSGAVYDQYLRAVEEGHTEAEPPKAADFGLPDSLDFYAHQPDYVIQGYQNYKDSLRKYAAIETDFAHGVLSFVLTDSLLDVLKLKAPREAYPNKEYAAFQHEMKKFFERGGDMRVMNTLTAEGFDTLRAGEYFFAVGLSGKVRFGRELLREEVKQIEEETGRKVPRANHAFLFPGEPVLTAGAFFIERDSVPHLIEVNAQSGHYFYSNLSPTIREDIALRSNHYLLTLGHFFIALDSLGIDYDCVLISKF